MISKEGVGDMEQLFFGEQSVQSRPIRETFQLHMHDFFEIFLFIDGDVDYIVEGTCYPLRANDVIIINRHEMHRAFHKSQKRYERIVFHIDLPFFQKYHCEEYMAVFQNRDFGKKNKIPAEAVESSGLLDAVKRWLNYTDNGRKTDGIIACASLIEILHILNNIQILNEDSNENSTVSQVIYYINKNFRDKIVLDELAERFYLSKYHLCRIFKEATGHTVISYINNRRIAETRELYKSGMSIGNACMEAGFSSYTSFYKAYHKQFGVAPKFGLR